MARIDWRGKQVAARVAAASTLGVDKTMSECVHDAKSGHPAYPPASEPGERYANRIGFASGSIQIFDAASFDGRKVSGSWGSGANYALYLEIGTSRKDSGFPRAQVREAEGGGDMNAIPPPSDPPLMAARPVLRPAADAIYPRLPGRIGAAYRGESLA